MSRNTENLLTRREFLRKGLTVAAAASTVPTFLSRTAVVIQDPRDSALVSSNPGTSDERILVVVQLSGGNDGLNSVIPFSQDTYYKLRPQLAIPKNEVIRLNDELGLHPALTPLKGLYENGQLSVVQGVGYPNPDRSHFRSLEIWQSGVVEEYEQTGWIGRVFDDSCNNLHLRECSPTLAISVGATLNPALRGRSGAGVALRNPERLYRMTRLYSNSQPERVEPKPLDSKEPSALDFLRRTALNAEISADRIRRSVRQVQSRADYPRTPFAQGLKLISAMIAGGMDTKVYYIALSGFDTHANQTGVHERLLRTLAEGLAAFQRDLDALGHADRVVGMTFSEFGRRAAENGSRGTDHGQAAPMFVFGNPVRPGFVGDHPSLEELADGDLKYRVDFRSVYATILDDWLQVDSQTVLGQNFQKIPII